MNSTFANILKNKIFVSFINNAVGEITKNNSNYSYMGINFTGDKIRSFKFYFTYFDSNVEPVLKLIPELWPKFASYSDKLSGYHLHTPSIPGCGLTFAIKFDEHNNYSKGIYFRINSVADVYIEKVLNKFQLPVDRYKNSFDRNSHLKYLAIDDHGNFSERNYIYCEQCDFLNKYDAESDTRFSTSECLEISSDDEIGSATNKIHFIGLSRSGLSGKTTDSEIKEIVLRLGNSHLSSTRLFQIHGYYPFKKMKSVFLFSANPDQKDLISSVWNEYK